VNLPALVALADAPPVAALTLIETFSPISTMTWMLDVLADPRADAGRWFLVRTRAETVHDGYSSHAVGRPTSAHPSRPAKCCGVLLSLARLPGDHADESAATDRQRLDRPTGMRAPRYGRKRTSRLEPAGAGPRIWPGYGPDMALTRRSHTFYDPLHSK
jgi:hypothetical protein